MSHSGAQVVVKALEDAGVAFSFGIPGTHNIELYDALAESTKIQTVLVTDEQSASFMADGLWRASGRLGCVNLVPGAGLTHALSGIAEAFMDQVAMLVLACGIRQDTGRAFQLHDVDQLSIARPVTKAALRPASLDEAYSVIRYAAQIATTAPSGPVIVELPANFYFSRTDQALLFNPQMGDGLPAIAMEAVDEAAKILNHAKRPLIYAGIGCADGRESLVRLAETLQAPVATTLHGKGVFPEAHPLWLWPGFGDAAPPALRKIVEECDATLAVGCRFAEVATGSYGAQPPKPLIHVDIDAKVFNRNVETNLCIHADAADFLADLLPRLAPKPRQQHLLEALSKAHGDIQRAWKEKHSRERVTPDRLLRALQDCFGPEAIFATDSGNGLFLAMEHLRLGEPGHFLAPVDYSCMGYSVPAAIGAKFGAPELPVIALVGDGAFLMTGLETLTARQMRLPVLLVILRDQELAQIAQFQDIALQRKTATEISDYNLEALARGLGLHYLRLSNDAEIAGVLREAQTQMLDGQVVILEAAIDYAEATYFTRGVLKTNFRRLTLGTKLRFLGRALKRRLF